jgi:hypothetical protein
LDSAAPLEVGEKGDDQQVCISEVSGIELASDYRDYHGLVMAAVAFLSWLLVHSSVLVFWSAILWVTLSFINI